MAERMVSLQRDDTTLEDLLRMWVGAGYAAKTIAALLWEQFEIEVSRTKVYEWLNAMADADAAAEVTS